jgi:hypothetical protein
MKTTKMIGLLIILCLGLNNSYAQTTKPKGKGDKKETVKKETPKKETEKRESSKKPSAEKESGKSDMKKTETKRDNFLLL